MNKEDYFKYYIQGSDHYLIPKDIFDELFNEMINWKEESKELNQKYLNAVVDYEITMSDKTELEKQLEYLRSGEYLNQLRFERDMLQDLVDKKEISKEDKEFIDMTRRNTELLEQQKEFIKWLEDEKNRLARELSNLYEDSLGHTRLVNEDIFDEVNDILQKYKSIIGVLHEKSNNIPS